MKETSLALKEKSDSFSRCNFVLQGGTTLDKIAVQFFFFQWPPTSFSIRQRVDSIRNENTKEREWVI
jgi:hypothetical protein